MHQAKPTPPAKGRNIGMVDSLKRLFDTDVRPYLAVLLSVNFHANAIPTLIIPVLLWEFWEEMTKSEASFSLIVFVFIAGALGGITNNYMRLKDVPVDGVPRSFLFRVIAISQVYATPMVAGIFALVSFSLFASDLLQGSLFPEFVPYTADENTYTTVQQMLASYGPKSNVDAIKCLVWGFIAGFCERMIPNILDRMAEESRSSDAGSQGNAHVQQHPCENETLARVLRQIPCALFHVNP